MSYDQSTVGADHPGQPTSVDRCPTQVLIYSVVGHFGLQPTPESPSSLQLVPVTRIENFVTNGDCARKCRIQKKVISTNRRATELSL